MVVVPVHGFTVRTAAITDELIARVRFVLAALGAQFPLQLIHFFVPRLSQQYTFGVLC